MLYVPRGAIHHTSTRVNGQDSANDEPSMHFTAALPMDHQSLTWAMGVAPGPGVEQHKYLMKNLQKAAESLIAQHVSFFVCFLLSQVYRICLCITPFLLYVIFTLIIVIDMRIILIF